MIEVLDQEDLDFTEVIHGSGNGAGYGSGNGYGDGDGNGWGDGWAPGLQRRSK